MATFELKPRNPVAKPNRVVVSVVSDYPPDKIRDEEGNVIGTVPPTVEFKYQLTDADGAVTGWVSAGLDTLTGPEKQALFSALRTIIVRHVQEASLTIDES